MAKNFDAALTGELFQKGSNGQTIFYPLGYFSAGYAVPPSREASLRRGAGWAVLTTIVLFCLTPFLPYVVFGNDLGDTAFGLTYSAEIATVLAVWAWLQMRSCAGLQRSSDPRPSASEWARRIRRSRPVWMHYLVATIGVLLLLLAVAMAFATHVTLEQSAILGGFAVLCGSIALYDAVQGILERRAR